jgi:CheY-like chemotaxis protein
MDRKTILFVDDDEDDRSLLRNELIEKAGAQLEVIEVGNGAEAIQYLSSLKQERMPCLIILDLNMPVMDGRKTFEKIRLNDQLKHIPLVIYTSGLNPADREYFHKQGVKYHVKPMSLKELDLLAHNFLTSCGQAEK